MERADSIAERSARYAALGDPARLAIVDELVVSDRAPIELRRRLGIESNLLAHHLDVLERVELIERWASSGDGRRRYVHLRRHHLGTLTPGRNIEPRRALFVCSANSARSQLAAALWLDTTGLVAESAGTHPASKVHSGAIAAAARVGLNLQAATPRDLRALKRLPALVITVCDQAHEELDPDDSWLHWSIPDPIGSGTKAGFDATVVELRSRIRLLVGLGEHAA